MSSLSETMEEQLLVLNAQHCLCHGGKHYFLSYPAIKFDCCCPEVIPQNYFEMELIDKPFQLIVKRTAEEEEQTADENQSREENNFEETEDQPACSPYGVEGSSSESTSSFVRSPPPEQKLPEDVSEGISPDPAVYMKQQQQYSPITPETSPEAGDEADSDCRSDYSYLNLPPTPDSLMEGFQESLRWVYERLAAKPKIKDGDEGQSQGLLVTQEVSAPKYGHTRRFPTIRDVNFLMSSNMGDYGESWSSLKSDEESMDLDEVFPEIPPADNELNRLCSDKEWTRSDEEPFVLVPPELQEMVTKYWAVNDAVDDDSSFFDFL